MDKPKPTYQLTKIKELVGDGLCKLTISAEQTAHSLGFSASEVKDVILGLERNDFYKSTTEHYNHKVWQDVYIKRIERIDLYIKLKIVEMEDTYLLILSFKEDTV